MERYSEQSMYVRASYKALLFSIAFPLSRLNRILEISRSIKRQTEGEYTWKLRELILHGNTRSKCVATAFDARWSRFARSRCRFAVFDIEITLHDDERGCFSPHWQLDPRRNRRDDCINDSRAVRFVFQNYRGCSYSAFPIKKRTLEERLLCDLTHPFILVFYSIFLSFTLMTHLPASINPVASREATDAVKCKATLGE